MKGTEMERGAQEMRTEEEILHDRIRGCMLGGAAGDALGYAVEFSGETGIFARYGRNGITEYALTGGKGLISDDTQMSLFTANGLLFGMTRGAVRGIAAAPSAYVSYAYHDWYLTQTQSMETVNSHERYTADGGYSWLLDVPELYSRRAPGNTCLSALHSGRAVAHSKGCGGIMRAAPVALCCRNMDIAAVDRMSGDAAALTHGHSLGYMPAAVLGHILYRILEPACTMSLKEIILEAGGTMAELYPDDRYLPDLQNIIHLAVELAENGDTDLHNIHRLGEGWVAEETLAIALYCALRHQNDFSAGIIAAVNHNGDSDSTGAVTGNILGAFLGLDAMEEKWKQNLELSDVILEIADDLYSGCRVTEYTMDRDPVWVSKYVHARRPGREQR